jgi:hypothetical protein
MKPLLFFIGMFVLFIILLFTNSEKENWLPILAYILSLSTISFLIIIDRYRFPKKYKNKKN